MTQLPPKRVHSTKQRAAISAVLAAAKGPLSAEEIWEVACRQMASLSLRTVFRNLQERVDEGTLFRVMFPGQPPRYEKPADRHHPHFVCLHCEGVYDLLGRTPEVGPLCELPAGFEVVGAEVTLFGRCATCAAKASKPRRKSQKPAHA